MVYGRYALTLIALAGCAFAKPLSTLAPLYLADAPPHDVLNNSYIVMFHDDVPSPVFSTHLDFLKCQFDLAAACGKTENPTWDQCFERDVSR